MEYFKRLLTLSVRDNGERQMPTNIRSTTYVMINGRWKYGFKSILFVLSTSEKRKHLST